MTSKKHKDENLHSIYVSLDCLLDTRLGTLALVNEDLVEAVIKNNYLVREEENFPPLKKQTFLDLYKTRDKEVLKLSPLTLCCEMVSDMALGILTKAVDTPYFTGVEIVINTYPYKLTQEEEKDLLTSFVILTNKFICIRLINVSVEDLKPDWCCKSFACMVMYNYDEWLEYHVVNKNFQNIKSAEMVVYGPKIFFNRKPTNEELKVLKRQNIEPFKLVEEIASTVIKLQLLDIGVFCMDIFKYEKVKEQLKKMVT